MIPPAASGNSLTNNDEGSGEITLGGTGPTTNALDQAKAQRLKERLDRARGSDSTTNSGVYSATIVVPAVTIDPGSHKYVLITAEAPHVQPNGGSTRVRSTFVVSKRGAAYHRDAAEPFVDRLETAGYRNIAIEGGGRIFRNDNDGEKAISIFGHSYGFGRANHAEAKATVDAQSEFSDYEVTWSNEGY
jgi:hypothetical protein